MAGEAEQEESHEEEWQERRNRLTKLDTERDAQPTEQMCGTLACDYVVWTLTNMELKQH